MGRGAISFVGGGVLASSSHAVVLETLLLRLILTKFYFPYKQKIFLKQQLYMQKRLASQTDQCISIRTKKCFHQPANKESCIFQNLKNPKTKRCTCCMLIIVKNHIKLYMTTSLTIPMEVTKEALLSLLFP